MKSVISLLIIIFFLTLAFSVNAENTKVSGSTPLNFTVFDLITANSVLATVNVIANTSTSIKACNIIDTDLDFTSNTTLGNFTINITRSSTTPVSTDLSGLYAVGLKYVSTNASNKLNSSVLTWNLIKIYYTDAEVYAAGVVEDSLSMYWYNTTSSQWIKLTNSSDQIFNTGVNTNENYVWVNSTFFSSYAIGGLKANGQSCSANAECYSNVCCNGICQSSCPTVTTTTPAAGGGGGGVSPTTITVRKISDFTLSEDFIKVLLKPGETERRIIDISNTGKTDLTITVNLRALEDFLVFPGGVSEYEFNLDVDKTKSIQLNFFASEKQEPGVYPGKVVVTGDGIEKIITVIVEVESEKPLFDIDVEIPQRYKEVLPGEEVLAQLMIYNIRRIGRVDVDVEYGIEDVEGNVIVSEYETLAVELQVSVVRRIDVPFDVKPGNYVLYGIVRYNNVVGTGTDLFKVTAKKEIEVQTIIILALLLITVMIVSVFLLTMRFVERKIKELRR